MKKTLTLLALLIAITPLVTNAQGDAVEKLFKTKSLKCTFEMGTSGDWEKGELNIEKSRYGGSLHFDSIDLKEGEARLIGKQDATDVMVIVTPGGITFMELTDTGNVIFTTVFPEYKKGTRDFIAVSSRHMNLPGGPLTAQYYGTCKVWE